MSAEPKHPFEFEVVSIHRHDPSAQFQQQRTPDGYRQTIRVSDLIQVAYTPQQDAGHWSASKIEHGPTWVNDWYDINARVAQRDLAVWQQSKTAGHAELVRDAFRAILTERYKLNVKVIPTQVPYLNLVVGSHGSKLQAFAPGSVQESESKAIKLNEGFIVEDGAERHFTGVTMKAFASFLDGFSPDLPIQDKTGLPGQYDFTLPWYGPQQYPASEFTSDLDRMPLDRIGLTLKRGPGPGYIFEIEHIEQPEAN